MPQIQPGPIPFAFDNGERLLLWSLRRCAFACGDTRVVVHTLRDVVGETGGEVVLVRVRARIREAQHGDGRALADDCRPGTVVVSAVPVRRACRDAGLVIDRFDLWRNGGYALWFDGGNVKALSVRAERGDRLWTGRPRPSRKRAVAAKGPGRAGFAAARSNISVSDQRVGPAP